ncbi:MAG: carboxypeptidase regulatory-like domain-containing protein [Bryobacteraceae bacterium]
MGKIALAGVVLGVLMTGGCGESGEKTAKTPENGEAPGMRPDLASGSTLTGKVAFTGKKPETRYLDMSATAACQEAHPKPVASEDVIVNANGTLANAFVWIKSGVPEGKWAAPSEQVVVDQEGCIYKPRVVGVVIGQEVEFRNSDNTNHNIHPLPRDNKEWNESQPPKGEPKVKTFDREEVMIPVKCNVHPWMRTNIGVVRHPFFAVTGDDGTFTIAGVPPGTYTVEAWHERFGRQEAQVTVAAKESKTVDFSFAGK